MSSSNTTAEKINKVYQTSTFRELGHQLIDLLANQLDQIQTQEDEIVFPHQSPEEALAFWQKDFHSNTTPLAIFEEVLKRSIRVHHPKNMGHQVAVPAHIGALAGLVSDLLSNGSGVYEMGMATNPMEKIVTDELAKIIGYDSQAGGFLTSGGTLANLTALLAARSVKVPEVWKNGHQTKLAVMVSEEAHYCIDRAGRILGLGDDGIIKIPVDDQFKIRTELLEDNFLLAHRKGYHVFALVGCASSTSTGSYDNLEELAKFSQKHNIWFHIDGAHGGAVVFSEKYKQLAQGIELADSITIDFHKMLLTPALNTALMFKQGHDAYKTFNQKAHYLWESQQAEEWYNSGKRTFECTKFMMAFKTYLIWKTYGKQVFEANINQLFDLTKAFAHLIQQRKNFELALLPEANIINFRYINSSRQSLNELNSYIRQQLLASGKFYIVQTEIKGNKFLRCTLMNPLTTESDIIELLDAIEAIVQAIE